MLVAAPTKSAGEAAIHALRKLKADEIKLLKSFIVKVYPPGIIAQSFVWACTVDIALRIVGPRD
jgi:hypothetical protein